MSATVEPPADDPLARDAPDCGYGVVRDELAWILDTTPDAADEWIDQHGLAAAEQRVIDYWAGERR